jgi:hypothetical protein
MFTEDMIEQMRKEIENPQLMIDRIEREKQQNAFIENTKKMFKEDGRNFEEEFKNHMENK